MRKLVFLLLVALLAAMSSAAITYVDAEFRAGFNPNTLFAPSAGGGPVPTNTTDTADGIWRFRSGFGLSPSHTAIPTGTIATGGTGTIFSATDNVNPPDNVPRVVTTVSVPQNAYDVYVYFWIDQAGSPWRIRAGLADTVDPLPLFIGGNGITSTDWPIRWVGTDSNGRRLLQAYLGQTSGTSISVFVEDAPATTGNERTWYDGIGYEKVYNLPNSPSVTPANVNGTVGTLISTTQAQVTLNFNAGADPNYPVNPMILKHYIYLSAPNDPNIPTVPLDAINQVHNPNPLLTDPSNSYGPITLNSGTTYYWQVEEGVNQGNGTAYPAGNPNNYKGPVWSFTTISPECTISSVNPKLAAVFAGSTAELNVTGTNILNYRWYKIGSPDVQLANGAKYSGVTTATLTIYNVQMADEGLYYCIVSNAISTASNRNTGPGRVMIKRLVNHYPMEVIQGNATPDVVGGANMTLLANGGVLPGLVSNRAVGSWSLSLDPVAEPMGQYGQLPAGVLDYTDFTLTAWVYWKTVSGWQRIFDFGNDTTQRVSLTPASWGSSTSFTITNTSEQGVGTGSLLPNNQWVHVAVSLSGNTGRLYINGARVAMNTGMTHDPIDFMPVLNYIGRSLSAAEPYFNGLIDDLKIYNYALSNTQVAQEYIAVRGGWICDAEGAGAMRYDFNGDCRVDLVDFARFAGDWLNDNRIY